MTRFFNNLEKYTVRRSSRFYGGMAASSVTCQHTMIPNRLGLYGQVNKRIRWMPRR